MNQIFQIIILLLIWGCNSPTSDSEYKTPLVSDSTTFQDKQTIDDINRLGLKEFRKLYTASSKSIFDFSTVNIYEIYCPGECHVKSLFTNRTDQAISINKKQFEEIVSILTDTTTFQLGSAACYHPSVAIITYDEQKNPLNYVGICMDCNNYQSNIDFEVNYVIDEEYGRILKSGFTKSGRKRLRAYFRNVKFKYPDGGYSPGFDDSLSVRKELIEIGMDSAELDEKMKYF